MTIDQAHLDRLIQDAEKDQESEQAEQAERDGTANALKSVPVTPDGFLTVEAFTDGVGKGLFMLGKLSDLDTLAESPGRDSWPPAAAAVYDTIREMPSLHFLLRPGGKWMQRAFALGAFGVPVAIGCKIEAQAKRQARAQQKASETSADTPEQGGNGFPSDQDMADDAYRDTHNGMGAGAAPETVNATMEPVE